MSDLEGAGKLLSEAAARSGAINSVIMVEGDAFEVSLADGRDMLVEFDETTGRLMFTLELGKVPAGRREVVYGTLLAYNSLWRQTGSVRMATTGDDDPVLIMADLFIHGLDAGVLSRFVQSLLEKARIWSAFVSSPDSGDASAPSPELMIRIRRALLCRPPCACAFSTSPATRPKAPRA